MPAGVSYKRAHLHIDGRKNPRQLWRELSQDGGMVAVDIIRQNLGENSYQILVDEDIIPKAGSLAREYLPNTRQAFVLTNTTVGPLYGQKLVDSLEKAGIRPLSTRCQMARTQNFAVLNEVYDALLEAKIERQGSLWALGEGGWRLGRLCCSHILRELLSFRFLQAFLPRWTAA